MKWLKRLFQSKPPEPEGWWWECIDCDQKGTGDETVVRGISTTHCLLTGHAVTGGVRR